MEVRPIMKNILLCSCITVVIALTNNSVLASPGGDDLIKMARSGVDEEVLATYIDAAPDLFDLSADEIITLKDLGVPSKVINEALRHGHANETDSTAIAEAKETITAASNDTGEVNQAIVTSGAVAPEPSDQNISFFYKSLYPYGNWLNIDGKWCWQPNAAVISPDWTPYCRHGHWVNSDWGWCWVSDYSWGWAPFHYGRWFRHNTHGWCWVPDNEWGPAWVVWRSGNDYCGWAPLPPNTRYVKNEGFYFGNKRVSDGFEFNLTVNDYFFVPTKNFSDQHPWAHMVPSVGTQGVYWRSTMVKNSYGFENDHFINRGLPVEDVSRASNRKISQITIEHDNIKPGEPIHNGIIKENRLLIYKPTIAQSAPKNPVVIKSMLDKEASSVQKRNEIINKSLLIRQKTAAQQTMKNQQLIVKNSMKEKSNLEKAASHEADPGKKADIQAEARIQTMKSQQAQNHVANIKQWKPSAESKPAVIPQSRVVSQPSANNSEPVRNQVQNEARMEQQRQPAMEAMIRNNAGQQNNTSHPQVRKK